MKKNILLLLALGLLAPTLSIHAMDDDFADDGDADEMMAQMGALDPSQLADLMKELQAGMPEDLRDEFDSMLSHQKEQEAKYQAIAEDQKALEDELAETKNDKRELKEAMAVLLKDNDGRDLKEIAAEQKDLENRLASLKKERRAKKDEIKEVAKRKEALDEESQKEMEERGKAFEEKAKAFEDEDGDAYGEDAYDNGENEDAEEDGSENNVAAEAGDNEGDFSMPPVPEEEEEL